MFGLTRMGESPTVNSTTKFGETNSWVSGDSTAELHQLVANGAGNKSWFTNLGDEISLSGTASSTRKIRCEISVRRAALFTQLSRTQLQARSTTTQEIRLSLMGSMMRG